MSDYKKILVIIQRSNGDVFFSNTLIFYLKKFYKNSQIDLLINEDTLQIAKLLKDISNIYTFSYKQKRTNRLSQEIRILRQIYKKYDLSICLTASDRSVIYCLLSGNTSISAVELDKKKSWWKRLFLSKYYFFNSEKHIMLNNSEPLNILNIPFSEKVSPLYVSKTVKVKIQEMLKKLNIKDFLIFHPSAQYEYKIYPKELRNELFVKLASLEVPIIITGGRSKLDLLIKENIPKFHNLYNFIGLTSIEEYVYLSELSLGYIGMDTLNMHISASQRKKIFAIFGPTNHKMWSPWSNSLKQCAEKSKAVYSYNEITIFQAELPCVPCGKAGCDDSHGESECLKYISPDLIFSEIKKFINV